jgi:hypothetical protein
MPSLQNHLYARLTCTSEQSRRSERIANTYLTISIRIISTGIDRGSTRVRVVRRKLLMHPTEIKSGVDLANQMVGWHHLGKVKGTKELALSIFPPSHHALPR